MHDDMKTDAAIDAARQATDDVVRTKIAALADEVAESSRMSALLWALTGAVCTFILAVGVHNHRPLSAVLSLACIGFSARNVRASLDAAREVRTWRDDRSWP